MSASSSMGVTRSPYTPYGTWLSDTGPSGGDLYAQLQTAIANNDIELIKQILIPLSADEKIEILNRQGKYHDDYLLTRAIEKRSPEVMHCLITEGAKLTRQIILPAIRKKYTEMMTVILQRIDNTDFLRLHDEMRTACDGSTDHIRMIAAHKRQIMTDPHSLLPTQLEGRSSELREKDGVWWKCVGCSKTEEGCIYRFVFWPNGNRKPFPAVEPNRDQLKEYFPDELLELDLGYRREVQNGHDYVELPDHDVLRARATPLGIAESLGVIPSPGIADDMDFASLVASGHVPLSQGAEFFHDHAAHVIRRILHLVGGYQERLQQIEKGVGELVRVAKRAEALLEQSPNGICDYTQAPSYSELLEGITLRAWSIEENIALNRSTLQRLKITVGMVADLISSVVLPNQDRIDYLVPLIQFDVLFVLKRMWAFPEINAYLNRRSEGDLVGMWDWFGKQAEFDRFLKKVLEKIKDS